ncbi:MAG: enoyl-CoA hydratase/isomerase family protein [Nitrososphaeria archaeon]|nr:enoyl-CoA hydratase/isomerase family protein [Nitrososphaeria archaeon]NIN53618.1 enoyl-CoA hydratase/isomerase family protein [Nitrososphaeria archaeon]NIQ34139.1 enoyl-CoA hydratase/isomerase family protein [Nitrososphaeria archaeon]
MSFECILYEKSEGVAIVKLNRPHVLNAMNKQLWLNFREALLDAKADTAIKVIIITGEGRAFSTGADLKESTQRTQEQYREYLTNLQDISREVIRLEKPIIAAINGYALGSGYELALACDIRIASEDAKIGSPEARVSSSVTGGAMRLVQELVGPGKARELLFTAEYIDGKEAERIGLVNKVVPSSQLMESALEMARKIAENSSLSLRLIKNGLNIARNSVSLEALMNYEVEACLSTVFTEERERRLKEFEERKR